MMTENEAIQMSIAVSTAMLHQSLGDTEEERAAAKANREALYGNLNNQELQRVLRWTTRMFLSQFMASVAQAGIEPSADNFKTAWGAFCIAQQQALTEREDHA
jgi:hypothetical protein